MAAVLISACNSSATSPTRPFRAISPPASRRSIGSRNRQEPPSRSGRTGRREPIPRRDSLRPRVRSKPAGGRGEQPDRRSRAQHERPRRRGNAAGPPKAGENPEEPPRPRQPDTSAATRRFSSGSVPSRNSQATVEPFAFGPDLPLPGTLHHSGNRPAPPSEHTPLERRSAFAGALSPPSAAPKHRASPARRLKSAILNKGTFGFRPRYGQNPAPRPVGAGNTTPIRAAFSIQS